MNNLRNAVGVLTAACFLWAGHAQANLLTNGSFENTGGTFVGDVNNTDNLPGGSSVIPGWLTAGSSAIATAWIENGNPWAISASNGSFFLDLTGYADSGIYGGVTQTLTGLTIGGNYVLTFDLGYGGNSTLFGGPVTVRVIVGPSSGFITSGSGTPDPAVWDSETFDFTAISSAEAVTIIGIATAGGDYIGLDNADVELATSGTGGSVPEPGTLALFGAGLLGLGWLRRRNRA